jgi:hypothetical protein
MPKRALPRRWRLNKTMDRECSHAGEIASNSFINLRVEASICRTDAFYTKLKSGPLWQSIIEVQVIVAGRKERGIPKV